MMLRRSPIVGKRKPPKPKKPKPKTCKVCKDKFEPIRPMQPVCSKFECNFTHAKNHADKLAEKRAKVERQQTQAQKMEAKPIKYWLKRTETAVNAYIRFRDRNDPCISCGTWDTVQWEAGHFISVGACSSLRYDYANIHKQCHRCNCHQGGMQAAYRARLRFKIGDAEVERLDYAPRSRDWTREELQAIEAEAKALLKQAKKDATDIF